MLIRIAFLPLGLALLGFNALTCQGAVLFSSAGGKEIENIKVSDEAKATIGDRNYALKLVGAGLRYKKVAFIKAKVYVGEFFVDAPEKIHRDSSKALSSLENIKAAAIRMTFLRDVEIGRAHV